MGVMGADLAGRSYARVYRTSGRDALHSMLVDAVDASGGRVIYASSPRRAPIYLGVQTRDDVRLGLLVYPFTANSRLTRGRPSDEHRFQIRYGGEASWATEDHSIGWDIARVDNTLVLGVHPERRVFIGLDPALYDPLPMGISFEFKEHQVEEALGTGWHVYERDTLAGTRRESRTDGRLETVVIFTPDRFLDYARLEREATDIGLDPPLRYVAARKAQERGNVAVRDVVTTHQLERDFDMTSAEILDVINKRNRLSVAVRGGIAEWHLDRYLRGHPNVVNVVPLDRDSQPDFEVTFVGGRTITVECKNASPNPFRNGDLRVEVQKTRASQSDRASRFYRVNQFDAVAACLYAARGRWEFRFQATVALERHKAYPDRVAAIQRISEDWCDDIFELGFASDGPW